MRFATAAMPLPDHVLPDDLVSAARVVRAAACDAAPAGAVWVRYVGFYGLLLLVAGGGGYLLQKHGWIAASADGWKAVITLLTIVSGFMITTMLFTGKVEAAKSLHSVQLKQFVRKSNHLLFSQWLTLINHIVSLGVVGAVTGLHESAASVAYWLVPVAFGVLALSFVRSMLIPLQIIELHRFVHAALIDEKQREEGKGVIT
ncbi:hypothetical protein ACFQ2D_08350 [Luteimonas composti]|uniref:hypothetical protein n=1 Tax=Luteimonas composti TaxID=398257 RepID=UPI00363611FE